jgi:hypothetical protein
MSDPWGYRKQSRVDLALARMSCAVRGHAWWLMMGVRVCGHCGTVDRSVSDNPKDQT